MNKTPMLLFILQPSFFILSKKPLNSLVPIALHDVRPKCLRAQEQFHGFANRAVSAGGAGHIMRIREDFGTSIGDRNSQAAIAQHRQIR